MPSAIAPQGHQGSRGGRNRVNDPYSHSVNPATPKESWTPPQWVVGLIIAALLGTVSVLYYNLREDIKNIRDDLKDIRSVQYQTNKEITDLRIATTKMTTQLEQLIQRGSR